MPQHSGAFTGEVTLLPERAHSLLEVGRANLADATDAAR
jgi:hypothetical protein